MPVKLAVPVEQRTNMGCGGISKPGPDPLEDDTRNTGVRSGEDSWWNAGGEVRKWGEWGE